MEIKISDALKTRYPGARFFALYAYDLNNDKSLLEKKKSSAEKELRAAKKPFFPEIIEEYNTYFRSFGKKFPVEYQIESVIKGKDIPDTPAAVQALFITELLHSCLMSAHDMEQLTGSLLFDLSAGTESYVKIDGREEKLKKDDIVLRDGDRVIASAMYGPDTSTKVTNKTKNSLFLLWLIPGAADPAPVLDSLKKTLRPISGRTESAEVLPAEKSGFVVTPWEVRGNVDYDKLIKQFGTEKIDAGLIRRIEKSAGETHHFLRRGIYFSHRDLDWILDLYEKGEKFHLYTGRGPSGKVHLGHLIPWMMTKWLQDRFDTELWFQMTDDEKYLIKDKPLEEFHRLSYDNALDVIAIGFSPKKTHIFSDLDYIKTQYRIAMKVAKKTTLSTVKAIFGFTDSTNIGITFFPAMQTVPCFLPSELRGKNIPVLIPASIDQDNYWRMARDVAGKLGYYKPAQIHGRFLPGLQGMVEDGKMSSSVESTAIFTTDPPDVVKKKVLKYAFSGGRDTVEEHRRLGGVPEVDVAYQWLTFFEPDDRKLAKIYQDYKSGRLLSGELKMMLVDSINAFLSVHQKKREEAKKKIDEYMLKD